MPLPIGDNKSRFLVMHQTGSGNKSAHMKYFLFIHPDYFVKESLKEKGDLSKGIKSLNLRPGASVISVRDLVDF